MVKKSKKNRFTENVDIDIVYSSNTIAEVDPTDCMAELNISKEKAEELQKIRAKLPTYSNASMLENELAKLPTEKPFRAFVHNVSFSATQSDIAKLFEPLEIVNINMVSDGGGYRGFCFVDFATRDDLAKALERNDCPLAGRPVNVRIAAPNVNDRGGGGYGRDRHSFGGRRGDAPFDRNRTGGYRPAALRDELNASGTDSFSSESPWKRGSVISNTGGFPSSSGNQRPLFKPRNSFPSNDGPSERSILNAKSLSTDTDSQNRGASRNASIFGLAKPVDTASKDREIEQRLAVKTCTTTR